MVTEEITGTFLREFVRFDDGTIVASLNDGTRIKGKAEAGELAPGISYRFAGKSETHEKFGKQFCFRQFQKLEPHTKHGLVKYLQSSCPHVGPVLAGRLFDAFRQDAVKVLRTEPERAAAAIEGLPLEKAKEASAALSAQSALEDTKIELMDLFVGKGFPGTLTNQVIKRWGIHAPARIRRDPFSLLVEGFGGCGFARCDRLYTDLGHPLDRLKRQMICLWHSMREESNGNTWHLLSYIESKARQMISGSGVNPKRAIKLGIRSKWLAVRECERGMKWIAVGENAKDERDLAESVTRLQEHGKKLWPKSESLTACTVHQRETVANLLTSPVCILTGGPGTGKTFTVASTVKSIKDQFGLDSISVAAPTGKAAVRCTEAFTKHGLTIEATTIHRLLGVGRNGHDGKGWGFLHNESNPLLCRFLIVDEASMLDTKLAASIFRACQPGTHVLLVGDPYQLPPVGHGAPLRDMLDSPKIPSGELTKIERNSGDIIRVCQEIRQGKGYRPSSGGASVDLGRNVRHWESASAEHQAGILTDLLCSPPPSINPIWDVQVICAVNEKSPLGRKFLNRNLQELFNAAGERVDGCQFRVDDKVICTSNTLLPRISHDGTSDGIDEDLTLVANGEIGRVIKLSKKWMAVSFASPARTVKVLFGQSGCEFDLGYAITCHKAQGSQSPIIIVMVDDSGAANQVCSREWHMTAMSRPERLLVTIGKRHVVDRQCRRIGLRDRKTFLKEILSEGETSEHVEKLLCPSVSLGK